MIKNSIGSNEFQGLARSTKGKNKIEGPTVKAPKFNKKAKQKLIPYGNESPQRRNSGIS